MGAMPKLFSSCSYETNIEERIVYRDNPVNPDPSRFEVKRVERIGDFVIAMINYPNCTNYEGNKILVFHSQETINLVGLEKIDPHFCDEGHISPIARFEPTERGWMWAKRFAKGQ